MTKICCRKSWAQWSGGWAWRAIVTLHWRPGEAGVKLVGSVHAPATEGLPDKVITTSQDREIIKGSEQHIVSYVEISWSPVPRLVCRIVGISCATGKPDVGLGTN